MYNGCLVWYDVLLIPRITQACNRAYSQLGYMLISCHCDILYMHSVRVGWLLTSQMLALCLS